MKIFFYGFAFREANQVANTLLAESHTAVDKGAHTPSQLEEDLVKHPDIDIILMDPGMPEESGLQLISKVAGITKDKPMALITHDTAGWSTLAEVKKIPYPVVGYTDSTFRAVLEKVTEKAASHH